MDFSDLCDFFIKGKKPCTLNNKNHPQMANTLHLSFALVVITPAKVGTEIEIPKSKITLLADQYAHPKPSPLQ